MASWAESEELMAEDAAEAAEAQVEGVGFCHHDRVSRSKHLPWV